MKSAMRKCQYCDKGKPGSKSINIDTDKILYSKDNKGYYHYDCFIKELTEKKRHPLDISEAVVLADFYYNETLETKKFALDRDRLVNWIFNSFNISYLSKGFYTKLDEINCGTYKGLKNGIENSDLLEIFKKMENKIHNTLGEMIRKGNDFSPEGKVNYALAMVLANYDSYLRWKIKQKKNQVENNELIKNMEEKNKINIDEAVARNNNIRKNNQENDEINISDMLDELF